MAYSVKEMYYTLQGEGVQAGMPAVFLRFSGCNFWNGREEDRATSICVFCDTDFVGTNGENGGSFATPDLLADAVVALWPTHAGNPMVVCTGGEPLLQLDPALITALKQRGFRIAIETNGSKSAPAGIDWIAVSPKSLTHLQQRSGSELKVVYPSEVHPDEVAELDFQYFVLSPLWVASPSERQTHLQAAIDYCKRNPQWRLSVQQHKYWNIP